MSTMLLPFTFGFSKTRVHLAKCVRVRDLCVNVYVCVVSSLPIHKEFVSGFRIA